MLIVLAHLFSGRAKSSSAAISRINLLALVNEMHMRKSTEVRIFRRRLAPSCSAHGGPKLTSLTTHSLESGVAGVIGGIQIPFQVL